MAFGSKIEVVQASLKETEIVSSILQEVANWLIEKGEKLWQADELSADRINREVENGMFWLAKVEEEFVGCLRYQLQDKEFWDDVPHEDSAFIHRIAVRRKFASQGISQKLINWAKQKAKSDGKRYLRLDTLKRGKLCRLYESLGFVVHSEKFVEPYFVVRYEFDLEKIR